MFKDVQLSKDLMSNFKKIFDSEAQLDIALDVNVVRKRRQHGHARMCAHVTPDRSCHNIAHAHRVVDFFWLLFDPVHHRFLAFV